MKSIIKNKDIILRKLKLSDKMLIYEYCKDKSLSRWIYTMSYPYTKNNALKYIKKMNNLWKKKKYYDFAIIYKGEFVGTMGIHIITEYKGEIGYWVGKPFWGQGIAVKAAKLLMKESFKTLKLHKIFARTRKDNKSSERVMKKLGMKHEGTLKEDQKIKGKYYDYIYYGILKKEFKN